MSVADAVTEALSAAGALARSIAGFQPRSVQQHMATTVLGAIETQGTAVIEAGTGTGKTFAYLVPALLAGGKVLISTASRNLQDQLYDKDLPRVRDALRAPVTVALLKGRGNYVCHFHLERTRTEGRLASKDEVAHLAQVVEFAKLTNTGDRAELASVPDESGIWPKVTSTVDNCLGSECPHFRECFVMKARRTAMEADVVVVNHHLFFADAALRREGVAELLPSVNTVIFDEAHQIPDVATQFFGEAASTRQWLELARDSTAAVLAHAREATGAADAAGALELAVRQARIARKELVGRLNFAQASEDTALMQRLEAVQAALAALAEALAPLRERNVLISQAFSRALTLEELLGRWLDTSRGTDDIRWIEFTATAMILQSAPLQVSNKLAELRATSGAAWILTSATLAVKDDFSHFLGHVGLDLPSFGTHCLRLDSPFDYAQQGLLYVPGGLPAATDPALAEALVAHCAPLVAELGGRSFFLCTTLRAVDRTAKALRANDQTKDLEILVQGEGGRAALLERFRASSGAVLVGAASFWEGIDVRGEALSMVVIDKLPFAPPDDPLFAARLDAAKEAGGNPFFDIQLPEAVITLKQGVGRLIRDPADRGLLVIGDARLVEKPYGKRIWGSLPPFARTREFSVALQFAQALELGGLRTGSTSAAAPPS